MKIYISFLENKKGLEKEMSIYSFCAHSAVKKFARYLKHYSLKSYSYITILILQTRKLKYSMLKSFNEVTGAGK